MARILLVHGAWHGPWSWDSFAERLTGHDHQVQAVRLRGHDQPPCRTWHRAGARWEPLPAWPAATPPRATAPPATASTAVKPELVQEVWGRTQAEIYPGMGQDLMLDQGWPQVADRVDTWGRPLPTPIVPASHHPHPGRRPTP